jgi:hypothetical protein
MEDDVYMLVEKSCSDTLLNPRAQYPYHEHNNDAKSNPTSPNYSNYTTCKWSKLIVS